MNILKHLVTVAIISLLLVSCEFSKEWDYKYDVDINKLVVHGFFSVDTLIVEIKGLKHPLTKQSIEPKGIVAELYEDNLLVGCLQKLNDSTFTEPIGFSPVPHKGYWLKVKCDNFPEVFTIKEELPDMTQINNITIDTLNENQSKLIIALNFNDVKGVTNFYSLTVYEYFKGEVLVKGFFNQGITSDNTFDGNTQNWQVEVYKWSDSVELYLHQLSPYFYRFLKSIDDFDNSASDPFVARPAQVFTNVVNGYGFFGAFSTSQKKVVYIKNKK